MMKLRKGNLASTGERLPETQDNNNYNFDQNSHENHN